MDDKIGNELIRQSVMRINESTQKIVRCLDILDDKDVWKSPNEHLNSVGNLILHVCGNIGQYIISSLGGAQDNRDRDVEFSTKGGYTKADLQEKLTMTIQKATSVILQSSEHELLNKRIVQGMEYSGIGVIIHVTEHISYHTGQIIFLTKLFGNLDMGFYAKVNLNKKNQPRTRE
jgi:uncharacterized damage-inducible protein DinB